MIRKGTNLLECRLIHFMACSFPPNVFPPRVEYEGMRAAYKDKGRSKHSKSESFSTEQLQASFLEYQEEAALFIFRLRSLKQGQFLSILTQAARHHAAQVA